MSRITNIFKQLNKTNKKAFIPFITAGDGGMDLTLDIMCGLVANGADIIELGVPFSDPAADGNVIAKSHQRAVENGINLTQIFDLVLKFRQNNDKTAIILMGYLNPIEAFGYQKFTLNAKNVGIDGVLVVDMPPEESLDLKLQLDKNNIDLIFLIAPTTADSRLMFLKNIISGFVYFISLKGITGAGNLDIDFVNDNLVRIKSFIDLPICVGFGIKDANSAKLVAQNAEGIIIGSSLIKFIEKYQNDKGKIITSINNLANKITKAIK